MKILIFESEIHSFLPSLTPKTLAYGIISLRQEDPSREKLTDPREKISITDALRFCNKVARPHLIALQ